MTARNLTSVLAALIAVWCIMVQTAYAQQRPVSGRILDVKTGSGVPGASITVKGTQFGTTSDGDGAFKLSVGPDAKILVITSVGFATKEVSIDGISEVTAVLEPSTATFDEVVVIGYGTQKRREVTGAITKVSGDKINSVPAPSFEAGLQGRAAGVQVVQGSGLAGSASVVRIRGLNSISAGGDPLYVVDGVPITADNFLRGNSGAMNQNPLAAINPQDIESIEVLKDAAAAGIYGSRGANGVILITTKRGKSGKPSFNYSNRMGFVTYANRPDFVSGSEWLALKQEAHENDGGVGLARLPNDYPWEEARKHNTDWWDAVTRVGFINQHNLSSNFGSGKMRGFVSANYSKDESYLKGNSFERFGLRTNLDFNVLSNLKVGMSAAWNRGVNNRVPSAWAGGLGDAQATTLPIYPIYNEDGSYFRQAGNPVMVINESTWKNRDDRFLGSVYAEYTPIKGLILRGVASLDFLNGMEDRFETGILRNAADGLGATRRNPFQVNNQVATFTGEYKFSPSERSSFAILAGAEAQESRTHSFGPYDFFKIGNTSWLDDPAAWRRFRDSTREAGLAIYRQVGASTFNSFFTRINYSWSDKFFVQFSMRADGSSSFGPNNKYGFFPSGALGYVLSEENFIKNLSWVNYLKFRTSIGQTGNSSFPSGQYYDGFSFGNQYNTSQTLYLAGLGNPNLQWETVLNYDAGLDFTLFSNRLTGEISYYNRASTNILLNAGIAPSSGSGSAFRNVDGKIVNQGVELTLDAKLISKKNFEWTLGGNISKNYNEVKDLGDLSPDAIGGGTNDTRVAIGFPIGTNFLVRYHGVDPTDGMPIWLDRDGKQTKTFSLDNRVPVGAVIPDFVGGFNTKFRYKNFELFTLFAYTIGGNIYDGSGKRQLGIVTDWNIRSEIADRWRNPGDVAKFPRLTLSAGNYDGLSSEWNYNSTLFLHDASFLRMRELTIGYNLPSSLVQKAGIGNIRVFVTGMNLLTFTKYPGGDPEIARDFENPQDRNLSPNVTYLTPPQQKSVTFGLNVSF